MKSWRFILRTRLVRASPGCHCRGPRRNRCCIGQSTIRAETWEAINRTLLASARRRSETGKVVRLDSTVTAALMHERATAALWDAVRVLVRLLKTADALVGGVEWRNHRRAAKKRARAIEYAPDRLKRVQHYRELIKLTRSTWTTPIRPRRSYGERRTRRPPLCGRRVRHYRRLIERIIAQTERRVLHGEAVAANEKIVSLFEPHADIIVKGGREVQYGHKLNLTTGRSGLILDLVIEAGNPADSERFLPMLKRHIALYGEAPRQTAADGGSPAATISARRRPSASTTWPFIRKPAYASRTWSRATGSIASCATSSWHKSDISCLKRAYGLARCLWRGLDHFAAYVWSSVVATTSPSLPGSSRTDALPPPTHPKPG